MFVLDDGSLGSDPKVGITGAFVIFVFLVMIARPLGVLVYKWHFSRNFAIPFGKFKWSEVVDRFINLLVNCLVVTPFMVQTDNIKILKERHKEFLNAEGGAKKERLEKRRSSLKRKTSLMRLNSAVDSERNKQTGVLLEHNGVFMPGMSFLVSPLLYDDLRKFIRELWWENPSK